MRSLRTMRFLRRRISRMARTEAMARLASVATTSDAPTAAPRATCDVSAIRSGGCAAALAGDDAAHAIFGIQLSLGSLGLHFLCPSALPVRAHHHTMNVGGASTSDYVGCGRLKGALLTR